MRNEYEAFSDGFNDRVDHKPSRFSEYPLQSMRMAYALGWDQGGRVNDPDPKESQPVGVLVRLHR